ncbi:hypothetical protein GCM10022408_18660 [Hymenobacter fastidiosus]|uniref:Uncharacterized protein n=1 Tax=Hymenobacter fastidiosus TaxID=486264 RepID=A0ABP7S5R9_9BACT
MIFADQYELAFLNIELQFLPASAGKLPVALGEGILIFLHQPGKRTVLGLHRGAEQAAQYCASQGEKAAAGRKAT